MKNKKSSKSKTIRIIRRIARILGLFLILLTLVFITAELLGEHNPNSEPIPIAMILSGAFILGGLGIAWKWELPGALISLAGFVGIGTDAMTKPMMYLFPLTAMLFLICWSLGKLHSTEEEIVKISHSEKDKIFD